MQCQYTLKRAGALQGFHQLTPQDLAVLASGQYTVSVLRSLSYAEFSRNLLLLEAVRREVTRRGSLSDIETIGSAYDVLSAVQDRRPDIVVTLVTLPNFGAWAAECLIRLRAAMVVSQQSASEQLKADIGYVATFAAVAALRAGHMCRLKLPIRDGIINLPSLGYANVPVADDSGWAAFDADGRVATITTESWKMHLLAGHGLCAAEATGDWTPVRTVSATSNGMAVDLILDNSDPYLSHLVPSPVAVSVEMAQTWQQRLAEAWQLLTRHHRSVAIGIAEVLATIIPSGEVEPGHPVTATSGWAWGSVLLSLPTDALSFAEALTHEFHHLVLAAVEDIAPLTSAADDDLSYAPWRDDPRPRSALLQGSYAFFGVAGFWLRQSGVGSTEDRWTAQLEFARRSQNVAEALAQLRGWPGLTPTGHQFTAAMDAQLASFPTEAVPASITAIARQRNEEHRARWRRANATLTAPVSPR